MSSSFMFDILSVNPVGYVTKNLKTITLCVNDRTALPLEIDSCYNFSFCMGLFQFQSYFLRFDSAVLDYRVLNLKIMNSDL